MSSTLENPHAAAVTARSAVTLRKLASRLSVVETENVELRAKVASYERGERARRIATDMQEKGLNADFTYEEKVASLLQMEDLAPVESAVKMASTDNLGLVSVASDEDGVPGRALNSADSFAQFCVTGTSAT